MKHKASVDTFIAALGDSRMEVALAAIAALGDVKSERAGDPLAELVRKADFTTNDPTTTAAIRLLGRLKYRAVSEFLKTKADDQSTHGEVRLSIVLYFGRAGAVDMNDFLVGLVQDEDLEVITRSYAVNSVGKLGQQSSIPALREQLEKIRTLANPRDRARFSPLKLQLLTALVRLGDDSVEKELLAAARDDDARVRVRAIGQIGEARMRDARDLLEYIVSHDPSAGARRAAEKALKQLDGAEDESEEDPDPTTTDEQPSLSPDE
jgi:HEAT repeat protein